MYFNIKETTPVFTCVYCSLADYLVSHDLCLLFVLLTLALMQHVICKLTSNQSYRSTIFASKMFHKAAEDGNTAVKSKKVYVISEV